MLAAHSARTCSSGSGSWPAFSRCISMSGLQIGPDHQPWDWAVASSASAWASAACNVAQSSSALLEEAADSVVAAGGSVTGAADSAAVVFGAGELVVAMVVAAVDVAGALERVV